MDWIWVSLAVACSLAAVALVWVVRRRKPIETEAADPASVVESPSPLDLPASQSLPSRGVLVASEPPSGGPTLRVLLGQELARSMQSPPPFMLQYRTVSADLVPRLGELVELPAQSMLARTVSELSSHIRRDSLGVDGGKFVTLLRSDLDIAQLYPADGGGLRGWARDATSIVQQARLHPVQVPIEALEGGKSALLTMGKGGLAIAGFAISWPALALTAGFVALDTANQAQRRALDRRINDFIRNTERRELERRIATQRKNDRRLNGLFSRLLDDAAVNSAEVAVLSSSIDQEFEEARVAIQRLRGNLDEHQARRLSAKEVVSRLGLEQTDSVISELLHARGAIDQQRRFLLLEVATEAINPDAASGGNYADAIASHIVATAEADRALRGLIEDLRGLGLRRKNRLSSRRPERVAESLRAALSVAFPDEGAFDSDAGGLRSTLAVDSAGRVYQVATTVDIDAIEREDLHRRFAGDLHALVVRREHNAQV